MSDDHKAAIISVPEPAPVQRMHPLVQVAMDTGSLDPATLRELLELQRTWEAGEAKRAYTRALTALKRDLPRTIGHDQLVDYEGKGGRRTRYTHTSLAGAVEAITGPLTDHGFAMTWHPATTERLVSVTARLTHTQGHTEETTLQAPADTSGNKNPAQAIASTITLLSRYAALSLLGIATADMGEAPSSVDQGPDTVDAGRNLRAVRAIVAEGMTREAAETKVGRPIQEWTIADLGELRSWIKAERAKPAEPTADGELSVEQEREAFGD